MENKKTKSLALLLLLLLLFGGGFYFWSRRSPATKNEPQSTPVPLETAPPPAEQIVMAPPPVELKKPNEGAAPSSLKPKPSSAAKPASSPPPAPQVVAPPIEIHKELIPKDITIVRVYYSQMITGPGSLVEFDINGSGFNEEFEKMITAESANPKVDIKNLKLMTPNQIHGILVVKSDAPTGAVFPQVLIQGKIVFRAPEPFAVIRPGEVFNMIFTEMGENGRSGRFRVFTNLTQDMFNAFRVVADTEGIVISDLAPQLPFIVDGTINIGAAHEGSFGVKIQIADTTIWNRPGLIRVVRPNVGQTGLVQQVRAIDGFHRPRDEAKFILQGSGFQGQDAEVLEAVVDGFSKTESTFTFRSPGRMDLTIRIPLDAAEGLYTLHIRQKETDLITTERAFAVVGNNWLRRFVLDPALRPGGTAQLRLEGRDLEKPFIQSLKTELDTESLTLGPLVWVSPELAVTNVSAAPGLASGDYLIHLTSQGRPVVPSQGSLIRIQPNPAP